MKKTVAFLLCFAMLLPLTSCYGVPASSDDTADIGESTTELLKTPTDYPIEVIESTKYYMIEKLHLTTVRYSIYDLNGNIVLREETDRPLTVSMLNENVVDIRVGMGTGIVRHKYYDIQNNRFSQDYDYVAATSGNLVAYIDCSMADPMYNRKLVVRDIFDASTFCKSFSLYFSTVGVLAQTPILSASFTEGEDELELVYLSGVSCVQLTATLPIRHVVSPEEVSPEAEKAMQAYEAVLQNKLKVFDTDAYEFFYIRNGRRPYDRTPLSELTDVKYAYMDLDGDTVNELIIDCGDTLILRYYEGTVYMYSFTFRNLYDLNTDGSYSWNHMGQNFEYGARQLAFEGAALKTKELWRIVNDGAPDAEYYLNGESVSRQVLLQYFEGTVKEACVLAPLSVSWSYNISYYDAIEIAKEYWKAKGIDINAYVVIYDESYRFWQSSTYVILLGQPTSDGYTAIERVRISKNTGQIDLISDIVDGKG